MRRAFQSPYGGRGGSDNMFDDFDIDYNLQFQSPYGGLGRSDFRKQRQAVYQSGGQSPCGGIGTSDPRSS